MTLRDSEFGMVRLRAFGVYRTRSPIPARSTAKSAARATYTVDDLELQLRNMVVAAMTTALGGSKVPFLDMAGNQGLMSQSISEQLAPTFERYGVKLDNFTVENVSLPEELQKALDTRDFHGHGRRPGQVHPVPDGHGHSDGGAERRRHRRHRRRPGRGRGAGPDHGAGLGAAAAGQAAQPAAQPAPAAVDPVQKLQQLATCSTRA